MKKSGLGCAGGRARGGCVGAWSAVLPLFEDVAQHHFVGIAVGAVGFAHQFGTPGAVFFIFGTIGVDFLCQLAEQTFEVGGGRKGAFSFFVELGKAFAFALGLFGLGAGVFGVLLRRGVGRLAACQMFGNMGLQLIKLGQFAADDFVIPTGEFGQFSLGCGEFELHVT